MGGSPRGERARPGTLRFATLLLVAVSAMGVSAGASSAARSGDGDKPGSGKTVSGKTGSGDKAGSGKLAVTTNVANGAQLSGSVLWTASPSGGTVKKVDFLIDGTVRWTESFAPYQYGGDPGGMLNTTSLTSGGHTLAVKAYGGKDTTATTKVSVTVSNGSTPAPPPPSPPPTTLSVTSNVANGATLTGSVLWTATPSAAVTKIEFKVDGALKWTESLTPYQYAGDPNGRLDTTTLVNGAHSLGLTAYSSDGQTANLSISTTVSNTATSTPPPPSSPPPPPSYGSIPRFGIATGYKILTRSAADQAYELDQIKAVGGKIVRFDSTPNNQAQVDSVVAGVLARGMEPLLILWGTRGVLDPSTAAAFAGSQAAKWKGRVRLYEFANEPDLHGWTGTSYAQALIPVYDAIKAADPNAIVIGGALWKGAGGPVQFVTDMYNAGAKGHFDILSLHLYDDPLAPGSWNIWNMAFHFTPSVRSVMDAHGDANIPIASTETGGPVTSYGESGQATIVGHDFDALGDPRLAFICVYAMMDDDVSGFGLLRPDRTQRPAWAVYHDRAT
jgi:Cellulase (glycosyl hydrolase family 5)